MKARIHKSLFALLPLLFFALNLIAAETSRSNDTPLHAAAEAGDVAKIKVLLKQNVDVNAANRYGDTPLFLAAQNNHAEAIKLLLQAGANPQAKKRTKRTALH